MLDSLVVWFGRAWSRRRVRVDDPEQVLILAPHCLQSKECKLDLGADIQNCQRCGKCKCRNLLDLTIRHGVRTLIADGGVQALAAARNPATRVVIAVACGKELRAGILGAFPKPVIPILNQQPNGPCNSTDVVFEQVEAAVERLLGNA